MYEKYPNNDNNHTLKNGYQLTSYSSEILEKNFEERGDRKQY